MKRSNKGFTLIELLIVVVIIGILAAIAIPKFAATKEKAYLATMKTDLKNLATAEEGYASSYNGAYFNGTATSATPIANSNFSPSGNVSILIATSGQGYNAVASMAGQTTKTCDMFVGSGATSAGVATIEGAPACQP
ncbi:MAG: prepilin-type N-terminal cleavage/methylation domain-containing protein [Gemmatimonadaceae bacterium]